MEAVLSGCRMSDEGYSDDDDASWKVRRASSKCLSAIINSYPDLIDEVYPELSPPLLARFREREENVKMDIFNTYTDLLRQVTHPQGHDKAGKHVRMTLLMLLAWSTYNACLLRTARCHQNHDGRHLGNAPGCAQSYQRELLSAWSLCSEHRVLMKG